MRVQRRHGHVRDASSAAVSGRYNPYNRRMSILKVARMGHPVLRAQSPRARSRRHQERGRPEAHRRHDRDDGRVSRRRAGRAAGARGRPAVRRRRSTRTTRTTETEPSRSRSSTRRSPSSAPRSSRTGKGCLSIPDIRGRVPRAREIRVRALRSQGRAHRDCTRTTSRRASSSTRPIISTASCSSIGCESFETLTFLDEYSRYWAKD